MVSTKYTCDGQKRLPTGNKQTTRELGAEDAVTKKLEFPSNFFNVLFIKTHE